jgi:hypothetical protein
VPELLAEFSPSEYMTDTPLSRLTWILENNKAHIAKAQQTVEASKQKITATHQLLERAQDKGRRFQG